MADAQRKNVCIRTLGCRLNQAESSLMEERLRSNGYNIVSDTASPDIGIINTCTVTGEADVKSRKSIRAFIRENPQAITIVVGCYAQHASIPLADIEGIDLILGTTRKLDIVRHIPSVKQHPPRILIEPPEEDDFTIEPPGETALTRRVNLKIQDGCNCRCKYCIVPLVRGPARSRDMDSLLAEALQLVRRGAREIILTGVNTASYAYQGATLIEVLNQLNTIPGLQRIRISSLEYSPILPKLLPLMADPDHCLMPFLHLPIQSGCDATLRHMGRPYSTSRIADFLQIAIEQVPDIALGTDILVGFPGETDEQFDATCRFLESIPIAYTHVFKYSIRKGTPAADFPDQIPPPVKQARSLAIRAIDRRKREVFQTRHLRQERFVLFEEGNGKHWEGYTDNYLRVRVVSDEPLTNAIRKVCMTTSKEGFINGSLVD